MEIGAVTGFIGVLFPLVAIVWALRTTKAEQGGLLTLRQALLVGLAVSLILAAVGLVFYQLYYTIINPGFLTRLNATGTPTDTVGQLTTVVVGSVTFSLVIAAIAGLALRTRTPRR